MNMTGSWVRYVPLERALPLVEAVNAATTRREYDLAQAKLAGYQQRCEEEGLTWPCTALDLELPDDGRPVCCGIYLDLELAE